MLLLGKNWAGTRLQRMEGRVFLAEEIACAKAWSLKEHLWGPLASSGGIRRVFPQGRLGPEVGVS